MCVCIAMMMFSGVLPPLPAVFPYYADTTLETIFHVPPIGSTIEESGGSVDQHLQAIKNGSVVVCLLHNRHGDT